MIWTILILSFLGFLISVYLTVDHIRTPTGSSLCDISDTISCSLVNVSRFSEMFNVPIALFGGLWFVFLALLSWKSLRQNNVLVLLLGWNGVGLLYIIYLIYGEFVLGAICLLCTGVHIIVLTTFILSYLLYRQEALNQQGSSLKNGSTKSSSKSILLTNLKQNMAAIPKSWFVLILVLYTIPFVIFNLPSEEQQNLDLRTICLTQKGVTMYSSYKCGDCARVKNMLGDSFQYLNYVECHPQGENSQFAICQEKGIEHTPTWVLEQNGQEVKRQEGFLTMAELEAFAGCDASEAIVP